MTAPNSSFTLLMDEDSGTDNQCQVQLVSGPTDKALEFLSVGRIDPPPTATEIDRRQEFELHQDISHRIQKNIGDTFPNVFPNDGKTRYSNVHVLLIRWANEDPKLPVSLELDELDRVFSECYGFQTEKWMIPGEDCHNKLGRKIMDFIDVGGDSRRELKIVYYGGHGMLTKRRQPAWSNLPDPTNKAFRQLKWSGIQNTLEEARSDVLILLDCCASGTANTDDGRGTTELIAACGFDDFANPVGVHSFTKALITELIVLRPEPFFTVSILYNNILSRLSNWMPEGSGVRRKSPLYVPLTQNSHLPRLIQLSPRLSTPASRSTPTTFLRTQGGPCQDSASLFLDPWNIITRHPVDDFSPQASLSSPVSLEGLRRFALHIWVQGKMPLCDFPVETFSDWIRMMPILAQHVQVDAGTVDYCSLLKFVQRTLIQSIHQNSLTSPQTLKDQIALTQKTLQAANAIIDQRVERSNQAKNEAANLERTLNAGFSSVVQELREQRNIAAESAAMMSNTVAAGIDSVVEGLDKRGAEFVASTERIEAYVKRNLEETEEQVNTITTMKATLDEVSSLATLLPDKISTMLEDVVRESRETQKHELQLTSKQTESHIADLEVLLETVVQRAFKRHHKELLTSQLEPGHARTTSDRSGSVIVKEFATPKWQSNHSTLSMNLLYNAINLQVSQSEESVKYELKLRVFRRVCHLVMRKSLHRWTQRFRVFNAVPQNSPLFQACRRFNLAAVRKMFESGVASPFDVSFNDYRPCRDVSPAEETFRALCYTKHDNEYRQGLDLLQFLLEYQAASDRVVPSEEMTYLFIQRLSNEQNETNHMDCLRLILDSSHENPLEGTGVASFLTLENAMKPFFALILSQEQWPIDWGQMPFDERTRHFAETDRQMILDPEGFAMQQALGRGRQYLAFTPDFISHEEPIGSVHSLLLLASKTKQVDVKEACIVRLSILLRNGEDPRALSWLFDEFGEQKFELSPTSYARELGVLDLWSQSLEGVRWTQPDIDSLIDEELYKGVSEMTNGSLPFLSRDDCRRAFVNKLVAGGFSGLSNKILEEESTRLRLSLGVPSRWSIWNTLRLVDVTHPMTKMPGGWVDYGNDNNAANTATHGINFEFLEKDIEGRLINWSLYFDDSENEDASHDEQEHNSSEQDLSEDEDECWHDAMSQPSELGDECRGY